MKTRRALEVSPCTGEIRYAQSAKAVTRSGNLVSIDFRFVAERLKAGLKPVLEHRTVFQEGRHELGVFLWVVPEHALAINIHRQARVTEASEFARGFFFKGATTGPSVHDQYARTRAGDGIVPSEIALERGVAIGVVNGFCLNGHESAPSISAWGVTVGGASRGRLTINANPSASPNNLYDLLNCADTVLNRRPRFTG